MSPLEISVNLAQAERIGVADQADFSARNKRHLYVLKIHFENIKFKSSNTTVLNYADQTNDKEKCTGSM